MEKKKPEDQTASHPFIGFLVNMISNIVECMAARKYGLALEFMLMTFNSLYPKDTMNERGTALRKNLMDLFKSRGTPKSHSISRLMLDPVVADNNAYQRDAENLLNYHALLAELQAIIWSGGYYSFEFYQKAIPSAGDNVSGSKPLPGLPGILSSRISE